MLVLVTRRSPQAVFALEKKQCSACHAILFLFRNKDHFQHLCYLVSADHQIAMLVHATDDISTPPPPSSPPTYPTSNSGMSCHLSAHKCQHLSSNRLGWFHRVTSGLAFVPTCPLRAPSVIAIHRRVRIKELGMRAQT